MPLACPRARRSRHALSGALIISCSRTPVKAGPARRAGTGRTPRNADAGRIPPSPRADGDDFSFTDFSLDMTTFGHNGRRYCVWAEKVSVGRKISNLYIAEMADALTLRTPQMLLYTPSRAWERHEFWVNEGPVFIARGDRVYLAFSASDTSPAYCMGLLWAEADAGLMDISAWHKVSRPVFVTDAAKGLYGPGHNTFFTDAEGEVCTSCHARQYDEITGDPRYGGGLRAGARSALLRRPQARGAHPAAP